MSIAYRKHHLYPKNIYIRDFAGRVDVVEIIQSWEFLLHHNLIHEEILGVINNLTDCQLDMDMNSFHTLIGYLKEHDQLYRIKLAVICDDPRMIVFPTLGAVQEKSLKIKPFASEEAAVEWIMTEI